MYSHFFFHRSLSFNSYDRNSLSSTFTTSAETLRGTITKALASRKRDNSTIYLEPVPAQATLKDVPGAVMVKAVPFVEGGGSSSSGGGGEFLF